MAFEDDFSAFLARQGVNLPVASIPKREIVEQGLRDLHAFINSLDGVTAGALDEITQEFPVKALLAQAGAAPALQPLLAAFDQSRVPFSVSQLTAVCSDQLGIPVGRGHTKPPDAPVI